MLSIDKKEKLAKFEKLYFDSFSRLCHSVYRFVKNKELTKDIVQEVFLRYWQKINEITFKESPDSYLHKACINQAINHLKEADRRAQREHAYSQEIQEAGTITERPDMKYETSETSMAIQHAIDQLPPACKIAFLLSRHEDKSYKEIAVIMGISINTVEKHIGKALRILREQLKSK